MNTIQRPLDGEWNERNKWVHIKMDWDEENEGDMEIGSAHNLTECIWLGSE